MKKQDTAENKKAGSKAGFFYCFADYLAAGLEAEADAEAAGAAGAEAAGAAGAEAAGAEASAEAAGAEGAAAAAAASAAGPEAGAEAAGADASAGAGATVTFEEAAGAGASSFLLQAARATTNKDAINKDFFMKISFSSSKMCDEIITGNYR